MANMTEELNFEFHFILIQFHVDWWLLCWIAQPKNVSREINGDSDLMFREDMLSLSFPSWTLGH